MDPNASLLHRFMRGGRVFVVLAAACVVSGCRGDANASTDAPSTLLQSMIPAQAGAADAEPPAVPFLASTPRTTAVARASWPHDTAAYTQGLALHGARLFESTGGENRSDIREIERGTGRVIVRTPLPPTAFGEGIAVVSDRVWQLTWKGGRGFRYDQRTLARVGSFSYAGEGWGLAAADSVLYMTDGSSQVRIMDPRGFREIRRFTVREGGKPVWMLNELEVVGNELWANIYETAFIARIDRATGSILGWIDVGHLLTPAEQAGVERRGGVSNGIAYDAGRGVVLVTGKLWPRMFELDVRSLTRTRKAERN